MLRRFPALLGPALLIALLSSSGTQAASSSASSTAAGRPPGPPPEAIAACKGKSEGTEVSFAGPEGQTFSGTCQSFNGTLAAMPKGGPGGQPPPPR